MLPQPAHLPEVLLALRRQPEVAAREVADAGHGGAAVVEVGDVRIPLAPLPGRPAERVRGHVERLRDRLVPRPLVQPALGLRRHQAGVDALERKVAGAVVDQDFGQPAVAEGAERLGDAGFPVAGAGAGDRPRTFHIRQELGQERVAGEARELHLVAVRRQGDHLRVGVVVLVVVVVVADEVGRRRAQHDPVQLGDLRPDRSLDRGLVAGTQHGQAQVQPADPLVEFAGTPAALLAPVVEHRALVPVDVVADRDQRPRAEGERPAQESAANRQRQEGARLRMAAGAGVGEEPDRLGSGGGRRERAERPRVAQRLAAALKLQGVLGVRFQAGCVEGEEEPFAVRAPASHRPAADPQFRHEVERIGEGALERHPVVARRRNQVPERAGAPAVLAHGGRTAESGSGRRRGGARDETSAGPGGRHGRVPPRE